MVVLSLSLLTPVGVGIVRAVAGWLENALEDGKISVFEWGQLGATVVRVAVVSGAMIFGLNFEPVAASASAFVFDFLVSKLTPLLVKKA